MDSNVLFLSLFLAPSTLHAHHFFHPRTHRCHPPLSFWFPFGFFLLSARTPNHIPSPPSPPSLCLLSLSFFAAVLCWFPGAVRASSIFPILSVILLFMGGLCIAASEFYKSRHNIILSAGIFFVSAGEFLSSGDISQPLNSVIASGSCFSGSWIKGWQSHHQNILSLYVTYSFLGFQGIFTVFTRVKVTDAYLDGHRILVITLDI